MNWRSGRIAHADGNFLRFDGQTGAFIDRFIDSTHFRGGPSDMRFHDGRLYVSQWNNQSPFNGGVLVFDAATGAFIDELVDGVSRSNALVFDASGTLFVSEFATSQVHEYDGDGTRVRSIGGPADVEGAMDVEFDADGNLLVGSWNDGSVRRFDTASGALLEVVVSGLAHTGSMGIAPDGTLLVDDHDVARIGRHHIETGELLGYAAVGGGLARQEKFTFGPALGPACPRLSP